MKQEPEKHQHGWLKEVNPAVKTDKERRIRELEEAVKTLESMNLPEISSGSVERLRHLQRPLTTDTPLLSTMAMASLALCLVIGLIAAILWQIRHHRVVKQRQADPMYRFKELLKTEDGYESIQRLLEHAKHDKDTESGQAPN